jgi:hypothetical protein
MELTIEQYGQHLFGAMVGSKNHSPPEHWESIRAKAEPLVRQLIALNAEMKGGGYTLVGYTENGKEIKSELERIREAQAQTWLVTASTLKEGDHIWIEEDWVSEEEPSKVEFIRKGKVAVDHHGELVRLSGYEEVLKAPDDWDDKQELYQSKKFWLEIADKLGI